MKRIAQLGFDHVRVPVDYVMFESDDEIMNPDGFYYLDKCREWCEENDLRMLIDLHECYGYSFDPLKKEMDRERFFYDAALQERFLRLWRRIAEHFSSWQDQIAFEPLNEVVLNEVADAWNKVAASFIRMMREIVPDSWLVIGGVRYNNVLSVPKLDIPLDSKIVYNFHCYEPIVYTHQGAYWVDQMPRDFRIDYPADLENYREADRRMELSDALSGAVFLPGMNETGESFFEHLFEPALQKAQADQVPLYCGEYGVIDLAERQSAERWLADIHSVMDRYEIGRALWNYKGKDFGLIVDGCLGRK